MANNMPSQSDVVSGEFASVAADALRTLPAEELFETIRGWSDDELSYALAMVDPQNPAPQPLRETRVTRTTAQ